MNNRDPKEHFCSLIQKSRVGLFVSMGVLVMTFYFIPPSNVNLFIASLFGLIVAAWVIASGTKVRAWSWVTLIVFPRATIWMMDWTFTNDATPDNEWMLNLQFVAVLTTVFFGVMWLFRERLKTYLQL